jgi:hypothetical protein
MEVLGLLKIDLFAMSPFPHLFDNIGSALSRTTQLYTQRASSSATPENFKFTVEQLAAYMILEFGLVTQGDVTETIVCGGAGAAYFIPAGTLLEKVVVYGASPGVVTINKVSTGGDIMTLEPYNETGNPVNVISQFFKANETLQIYDYTGEITVKFYFKHDA